ncbi:MAG: response regulator transcription factor [Isosphaeraceae bacterium]
MSAIRIVLADDHALIRAGIAAVIRDLADVAIVGEAATGLEALRLVETQKPDILMTDISMAGMNGLEVIARVTREFPLTRSIVLSMHTEKQYVTRALLAGAAGYLVKDSGTDEIERAIRSVARGETYLCPSVSGPVVGDFVKFTEAEASGALTPRQREILTMIAEGQSTKAIARRLTISVKTVEAHRSQLMERLQIHDVAGLVRYAIRTGLVSPED